MLPCAKISIPTTSRPTISCACGKVYHTRSTRKDLHVGICAACHPFFTGEQKFIDTAGRIEKFSPPLRQRTRPGDRRDESLAFPFPDSRQTVGARLAAPSPFVFVRMPVFTTPATLSTPATKIGICDNFGSIIPVSPTHLLFSFFPMDLCPIIARKSERFRELDNAIADPSRCSTSPARARATLREHTQLKGSARRLGRAAAGADPARGRGRDGQGRGRRRTRGHGRARRLTALDDDSSPGWTARSSWRCCRPTRTRTATPSWKSARAPAAARPRCSPPTCTGCTRATWRTWG